MHRRIREDREYEETPSVDLTEQDRIEIYRELELFSKEECETYLEEIEDESTVPDRKEIGSVGSLKEALSTLEEVGENIIERFPDLLNREILDELLAAGKRFLTHPEKEQENRLDRVRGDCD